MDLDTKILSRFDELIEKGIKTEQAKVNESEFWGERGTTEYLVDPMLAAEWGASCTNIIGRVFGRDHEHFLNFKKHFTKMPEHTPVQICLGILKGAKEDYEKGYLFNTKLLLEAEIFTDFLEQSEHLLKQGYYLAAAVIVGCVIEDGIRKLYMQNCDNPVINEKFDRMNADLAKAGIYNSLAQKHLTAIYDLRTKAAHGKWDLFDKSDVEKMIRDVEDFMGKYYH